MHYQYYKELKLNLSLQIKNFFFFFFLIKIILKKLIFNLFTQLIITPVEEGRTLAPKQIKVHKRGKKM